MQCVVLHNVVLYVFISLQCFSPSCVVLLCVLYANLGSDPALGVRIRHYLGFRATICKRALFCDGVGIYGKVTIDMTNANGDRGYRAAVPCRP